MESQQPGQIVPLKESISSKPQWNPHPYQERAIQLLLSQQSGGLLLDPGLGKTSIVLATLKILKNKGLFKRALIVAPLFPMYSTWPGEIKKWSNFESLTYAILHDDVKEWNLECETDIHLINPEGLTWLLAKGATALSAYDVLVIDESTRFKDSTIKRFKSLKPYLPNFKRRWILTGTISPNGLMDLFGQIYILDLGRSLGRYITHYRKDFFTQNPYVMYQWNPQKDALERIVERIAPLTLQLNAEDHLKMPELMPITRWVELPKDARAMYDQLEAKRIAEWGEDKLVAATAAISSVKLRQVANGAVYVGDQTLEIHNEKLDALESLLEELNGHSVLVLHEFDHDRRRINARIRGVCDLHNIQGRKLEATINDFNAGLIPILLGHPASMGHGLNLQGHCFHVIWFGIPWNYEYYDQTIDRVYRQGQKSGKVYVYHIAARNTKDEDVLECLKFKETNQKELFRAISAYRKSYIEVV